MAYKLGSLFDGSGGFPRAGMLCGVEPVWASEVEPYPIAVTKSRIPNMLHLGDITKVNGAEIEPVDIVTFGSPCQDLSVAGKRVGLKHEENGDDETTRSGLFMESIRIIKEMRCATNGAYPRFAFFENVPGAFSSNKGEDFRIVLEELVKIVEPTAKVPSPDKNGWPYADVYVGDGWSLAYRTFDAQYWGKSIRDRSTGTLRRRGTPQRRRRIHLVADFGGECAGKILFEREGLRGHSTQSRTPWQGVAGNAQDCAGADDRAVEMGERGEHGAGRGLDAVTSAGFKAGQSSGGIGWQEECAATLAAECSATEPTVCYGVTTKGNGDGAVVSTITGDHENRVTDYTAVVCEAIGINGDIAGTLDASYFKGCGIRQGIEREVIAIPIHDQATRFTGKRGDKSDGKGNGLGVGNPGDPMNTLTGADRHAVAYWDGSQTCGTLTANNAGENQRMPYKENFNCVIQTIAYGVDCRNMTERPELYPTLQAKPNGGQSLNFSGAVRTRYIVRRLTPTECARLQGFPDDWGHPDVKTELTDEDFAFWHEVRNTHERINNKKIGTYNKDQMLKWYNKLHTDSAEYKMWGNGICIYPALYCMLGIVDVLNEHLGIG